MGVDFIGNFEDALGNANAPVNGRRWSKRYETRDGPSATSNDDFLFPPLFDILNQA